MNYKCKQTCKNNQYSRRENIEIANISEDVKQQQLENHILKILHNLGLISLTSYDIVAVHRLGKKCANRNRSTIVRFINRKNAIYALKNKSKLKHSVYKNLYINENLSPENRNIFNILYKMKKEKYINDVWSANGKINFYEQRGGICETCLSH